MASISIDKAVPMPEPRGGRSPVWVALATMEVGDSFLLPEKKYRNGSLTGLANRRFRPKRFSQRAEGETWRIWRVA